MTRRQINFLFLFIGTIVSYFSCDRLQPWRRRTESVIGLCCLYTFTTKLWKHKPASEENSVRFFLNERWSLRSCIHVSELLPLGVCVTKFDTEYFELVISFFFMFSASLLLSCTSCPVFALDFSDILAKSSTKFLLIIFQITQSSGRTDPSSMMQRSSALLIR